MCLHFIFKIGKNYKIKAEVGTHCRILFFLHQSHSRKLSIDSKSDSSKIYLKSSFGCIPQCNSLFPWQHYTLFPTHGKVFKLSLSGQKRLPKQIHCHVSFNLARLITSSIFVKFNFSLIITLGSCYYEMWILQTKIKKNKYCSFYTCTTEHNQVRITTGCVSFLIRGFAVMVLHHRKIMIKNQTNKADDVKLYSF